jgi:hypothetical protein
LRLILLETAYYGGDIVASASTSFKNRKFDYMIAIYLFTLYFAWYSQEHKPQKLGLFLLSGEMMGDTYSVVSIMKN